MNKLFFFFSYFWTYSTSLLKILNFLSSFLPYVLNTTNLFKTGKLPSFLTALRIASFRLELDSLIAYLKLLYILFLILVKFLNLFSFFFTNLSFKLV